MPNDLHFKPAYELAAMILRREIKPSELMAATIARIEAVNPKINAFVALRTEAAMDEARPRDASVLIVIDGSAAGLVSNSSAKSLFGVGGNQYHPGVSFSMAPVGAKIPCYEIN